MAGKKENLKKGKNGTVPYLRGRILGLFDEYPGGLRASQIIKRLGVSRRTIYRHLAALQAQKLIKNTYPIWEKWHSCEGVSENGTLDTSSKTQLHNLAFVLRITKKPYWWSKRNDKLLRFKSYNARNVQASHRKYTLWKKDEVIIQFNEFSIMLQMGNYWGKDPYECLVNGMRDYLAQVDFLERLFNFKFLEDGIPQTHITSQDYVNLNDWLALNCKHTGNKFEVYINEKRRLWVDMSDPLGVESNNPEVMTIYQDWVKDIVTKRPPMPSEMAQHIAQILQVQQATLKAQQQTTEQLKEFNAILRPEPQKEKKAPNYIG